jgi:hypothetical protein
MDDNDKQDCVRPPSERERREAEIEARAAAAYDDLFSPKSDRNDWAKWMFIADGLMIGRQKSMRVAGTQEPKGKGYNIAFSRWMDPRPWARLLDPPTRNDLFWCFEHRSEIELYRDGLPEHERVKKNHPTHMKRAYLAERRKEEAEREGVDEDKSERERLGGPDTTALREELAKLRGDLIAERDEHGKTRRQRDEAYNNPLHVWQTNSEDAALKLFHDNEQRAEAIMRALATLFGFVLVPASAADKLASGADARAIIEEIAEQNRALREAARAARSHKAKAKPVDKPKEAGE